MLCASARNLRDDNFVSESCARASEARKLFRARPSQRTGIQFHNGVCRTFTKDKLAIFRFPRHRTTVWEDRDHAPAHNNAYNAWPGEG